MSLSQKQDFSTDNRQNAGDLQRGVDLLELAAYHLGAGLPGGSARVYVLSQFDPDNPEYHFFTDYFRNPATGDRGGAIRFVQRFRRCNYGQALAYLAGWIDARNALQAQEEGQL